MNSGLQQLCEEFIKGKSEVNQAFRLGPDPVCAVCSDIFLSHGKTANEAALRACKQYVKDNAGLFNNFRGSMYAPTASILACSEDPEGRMKQAAANYELLKEYFSDSSELVLASLILTEIAAPGQVREKAIRGKQLYRMLKEKHRFLTDSRDSVFAVMMAFCDKSDEAIIEETEQCMEQLAGLAGKDYLQTVAMILSMDGKPVAEKCARFTELFESIRAAGMRYGKSYELAILASLSLSDIPVDRLVADVAQAQAFLHTQKGYKGLLGSDKQTRMMHAAMLVTTYYTAKPHADIAAIASMLAAVAIQLLLMLIITNRAVMMSSTSVR